MGYTQPQAAQALGVSLRTIKAWEGGETAVPAIVPLACEALAAGLGPLPKLQRCGRGVCDDRHLPGAE